VYILWGWPGQILSTIRIVARAVQTGKLTHAPETGARKLAAVSGGVTAWHSSSGRQPNFAALN